ncbi:type II toxin-antitoxin system RelE family toxin [Anabaena sp. WA102]|uniref:type II toxin-antitoxin system RelE family toxin n=1 Tax=Anabaena sp. WA102 TaxID=1647413 RepID=UPI000A4B121C|nr:hypothetical protein [Anabaena sp. WA102]
MKYQIEFTKGAVKQLKKLPTDIRERIGLRIQELAIEPRPDQYKFYGNFTRCKVR